MNIKIYILTLFSIPIIAFSNINSININKIDSSIVSDEDLAFLISNQTMYNHWTPNWSFDVPKDSLVNFLKSLFHHLELHEQKGENIELSLLVADIAHYLYNLEQQEFFSIARDKYNYCIKIDENDYRIYWFLGNHYALSALPDSSIYYYKLAEKLYSENDKNNLFWEDYAFASYLASMPSHSLYAIEKANNILGKKCEFDEFLGVKIKNQFKTLNIDSTYESNDFWSFAGGRMNKFQSRALGMAFTLDSTWNIQFSKFTNRGATLIINPPRVTNSLGQKIGYTIGTIIKVPNDSESLDDFFNPIISRYAEIEKIAFSEKFDDITAYKIKEPRLYADQGGARLYLIGISRDVPNLPGYLLENPASLPSSVSTEVKYYQVLDKFNRVENKIYYAFLLDCCESIHIEAFNAFKEFFENQLVIE